MPHPACALCGDLITGAIDDPRIVVCGPRTHEFVCTTCAPVMPIDEAVTEYRAARLVVARGGRLTRRSPLITDANIDDYV